MMSEAEWLAGAAVWRMLYALDKKPQWDRKLRLFAVACCREVEHLLTDRRWQLAVEAAERFADAELSEEELKAAQDAALVTVKKPRGSSPGKLAAAVADSYDPGAAFSCAKIARDLAIRHVGEHEAKEAASALVEKQQCELLREVLGNPFRQIVLSPAWLAWEGGTVPELALAIYDRCRFSEMPYLGDALEEAGCTSTEVLDHCRRPAKHVRGCWVLDLVLEFS
jgi:hypothetical protein